MNVKNFHAKFHILILLTLPFLQDRDLLGDLNQDGAIDILDIIRTVNIVLEVPPEPTEYELWAGDVNVDEDLNISDIVVLVGVVLEDYCISDQWDYPCEQNYSECCYPFTSHEFDWEIDTIGELWSKITTISIINENNVFAGGEIIIIDSDTIIQNYNLAHWNGNIWQLFHIEFWSTIFETMVYSPIVALEAFAPNDIWMVAQIGSYNYYDGSEWTSDRVPTDGQIMQIWKSSPNDVWFVSNQGVITHFDGENFTEINTPVYERIQDIYGIGNDHIWVVEFDPNFPSESYVLEYDGLNWFIKYESYAPFPIDEDALSGYITSVWAFNDTLYLAGSAGLWKESLSTGEGILLNNENIINSIGLGPSIRGNHYNDIIIMNYYGTYSHFNGQTWDYNTQFSDDYLLLQYHLDYKNDNFYFGGFLSPYYGYIIKGSRN